MNQKKKFYQKRWFKITASVLSLILLGLTAADFYFRSQSISECENDATATAKIKCPFLAIAKPSMKNRRSFIEDAKKAGMSQTMAFGATMQVGFGQNGVWSTLLGKAPDIYNLENVHGISHCDRYNRHLEEVERMLKEREISGQVTIQDLVEIKEWIAKQEGVEVNSASKQETALLFGYAGGNIATKKVFTEDLLLLMNGLPPTRGGTMDVALFNEAQGIAIWER